MKRKSKKQKAADIISAAADVNGVPSSLTHNNVPSSGTFMSSFQEQKTLWLLDQWVPFGHVSVLGGPSGVGKSTFLAGLVAHGCAGPFMLPQAPRTQGTALWYSIEEQPAEMIRPKLIAANVPLTQVIAGEYEGTGALRHRMALPVDSGLLENHIRADRIRLVVFDPITSFLSDTCNAMDQRDVRNICECLQIVASRTNCAIVFTLHDRKGLSGSSRDRFAGSAAWTQVPRTVIRLGHDPDVAGRYVMASEKWSLTRQPKSRRYTLEPTEGAPRFLLGDECDLLPDDLGGIQQGTGERDALFDAKEFLRAELDGDQQRAKDLMLKATESGLAWATVRRAKEALRCTSHRIPYGGTFFWVWKKPDSGWT